MRREANSFVSADQIRKNTQSHRLTQRQLLRSQHLQRDSIEQAIQHCTQYQTICTRLFFRHAVQHCIVYEIAAKRSRWTLRPWHPIENSICRRIFCAPVVTRAGIMIHSPAVRRRFQSNFASGLALPPQSLCAGVVVDLPIITRGWRRRGRNDGKDGDSGRRRRRRYVTRSTS